MNLTKFLHKHASTIKNWEIVVVILFVIIFVLGLFICAIGCLWLGLALIFGFGKGLASTILLYGATLSLSTALIFLILQQIEDFIGKLDTK